MSLLFIFYIFAIIVTLPQKNNYFPLTFSIVRFSVVELSGIKITYKSNTAIMWTIKRNGGPMARRFFMFIR